MKGRNLLFTAFLVLAAGIALIIFHSTVSATGIVITGGALFILAGVFNLAVFPGRASSSDKSRGMFASAFSWTASAAAVILGLCMLIFQSTFAELIPFMFGVLIAFGALFQFYLLGYGSRPARLPGWLFIIPTLLAGVAIYLFVQRDQAVADRLVLLITGICLMVFGVITIVEASLIGSYNRRQLRPSATPASPRPADAPHPSETAGPAVGASNPSRDPE